MGVRARDSRRNAREPHPDSSAASRDREGGGSTVSPRAVPAKPAGGAAYIEPQRGHEVKQKCCHDCVDAVGAQHMQVQVCPAS